MEYSAFRVHERPQVVWAWDLSERNLEYLRGIDSRYFKHIAITQAQLLDGDSRQFAAATIRVAYGQGLETLLALIAAAMQAPDCIVGWMLAYRNSELEESVKQFPRRLITMGHTSHGIDSLNPSWPQGNGTSLS